MCCSRTKKWIIGMLLLAAVAAVAAGCLMNKRDTLQESRGTLVKAVKDGGEMVCDRLKDGGEMVREGLEDGREFLCGKLKQSAEHL